MSTVGPTPAHIAAHRGWHSRQIPENSVAALDAAVANRVHSVELDIRTLGDGTLVVHHDAARSGIPLTQLDARAVDASMPTLESWARRAGSSSIHVLAELKEHGNEANAIAMLRDHVPDERLRFMSFEHDAVRAIQRHTSNNSAGLLTRAPASHSGLKPGGFGDQRLVLTQARATGADFVGINVRQASSGMLDALNAAVGPTAVWTVNDTPDIARLLFDQRVGTVITDVPAVAQRMAATTVKFLPR